MEPADLLEHIADLPAELWVGLTLFTVALAVASLALMPRLLARLPRDYLVQPGPPLRERWARASADSRVLMVLRNLLGAVLLLLGFVMLFVPGQGVLTVIAGLALLDLPGRRKLVVALLARPKVASAVNKLRERSGEPPLESPAEG